MRTFVLDLLEGGRIKQGSWGTTARDGLMGAFELVVPATCTLVRIISTGPLQKGWEHVSVSCARRCPNWAEMCFVKALFFDDEETVVQFHPPRSRYVNHHPFCLHLWKPPYLFHLPPSELVGPIAAESTP